MKSQKEFLVFLLFISNLSIYSQTIEWVPNYQFKRSDYQSPATEIGKSNQIQLINGIGIYFNYNMTRAQFMFTKNFNSKVDCNFNPQSAVLVAPDSSFANELMALSGYAFDLAEVYARKFRKELYINKGVFSNSDFYKSAFEKMISDYNNQYSQDIKTTDFGRKKDVLNQLKKKVEIELNLLEDYCKNCKPKKK